MKTQFYSTSELIDEEVNTGKKISPLPLEVIPNHMGINLCSVEGLSWTKRNDGQLVSLIIHFVPSEKTNDN